MRRRVVLAWVVLCAWCVSMGGLTAQPAAGGAGSAVAEQPDYSDVVYGPHPRNVLDVWKSLKAGSGPSPVLIYFHGGSFKAGDKAMVRKKPVFEGALNAGIAVVSANYRFSSDQAYPGPMLDGARAVQFVRSKAEAWGLDPNRVALSGGSAGGTMALWIALHNDLADPQSSDPISRISTRVQCLMAYAAPSCLVPELIHKYTGTKAVGGALAQLFGASSVQELQTQEMKKKMADGSPFAHASSDDPPLMVVYGGKLSDLPFPEDASQKLWIHHVGLGVPLKEQYDRLGLEFQMLSDDSRPTDGEEVAFLLRHFGK